MKLKHIILFNLIFGDVSIGTPLEFDQHEITLGDAKYQTVLAGDLLGDSHSEFAVTTKNSTGNIALSIYALEKNEWQKVMSADLPDDILFVDIAKIAGRHRFIFYQKNLFSWFDTDEGKIKEMLSTSFQYSGKPKKQIPWVNVSTDLNEDNLDEFIIPSIYDFSFFIQNEDGTFMDPIKLGPPEPYLDMNAIDDKRSYREVGLNALTIPWYLSRVHFFDFNLDGRKDLVFRNGERYDVHTQTDEGHFEPIAQPFQTDVPMGTDGPYSLIFQFGDRGGLSLILGLRGPSTRTYMQEFTDINGDGIADIVTHTLSGRSPLKIKSTYTIYYGTALDNRVIFEKKNSETVFPSGRSGLGETAGYSKNRFHDFNNDKKKDLFRFDVRMGLGSIMRTLLLKTVYVEYEFFKNENDTFSKKPHMRGLLKTTLGIYPAIKVLDMNGDGKSEVSINMSPEEIHFYTWDNEQNTLSNQPQSVSASVPGSELNTWPFDLHHDGKEDIIMYHPSTTSNHRLVILTAE